MEFDPSKLAEIMGQAQKMQEQMLRDLEAASAEGQAGGGMVKVTLNGGFQVTGLKIDPTVVDKDDVSMLEDLVRAAFNDAVRRIEEVRSQKAQAMAGGLGLPNL